MTHLFKRVACCWVTGSVSCSLLWAQATPTKPEVLVERLRLSREHPVDEHELVDRLTASTNHYEWASLAKKIQKRGITLDPETAPAAFIRYNLVMLSAANSQRKAQIIAEIRELGGSAVPELAEGIIHAIDPAPIFSNSVVANIPIFSMQLLAEMPRADDAVPILIDFIDRFQTDFHVIINGKDQNQVVVTLKKITGMDFGVNKMKWRQWYKEQKQITAQTATKPVTLRKP